MANANNPRGSDGTSDDDEIPRADEIAAIFGVSTARDINEMLPKHRKVLQRISRTIRHLARIEAQRENEMNFAARNGSDSYIADVLRREPIFTFLIDGLRGAGKTSLAITIRHFLEKLAAEQRGDAAPTSLAPLLFGAAPLRNHDNQREDCLQIGENKRVYVHALPLMKPDDMDMSESIMEAVFAQMQARLNAEIARDRASPAPNRQRQERAAALLRRLTGDVAKGWYFARSMGVEALMNDSMSFDEYIERRAEEATVSHVRVAAWRAFVIDYLDFFDAQMLGIFVDDTDVSRNLIVDLLHSIRMFFSHPRIFSVVAANLHLTRQKLLAETMSQLSGAFETLREKDSYTARFWREFERDNLEEYLAKVFPRPLRSFISLGPEDFRRLLRLRAERGAAPGPQSEQGVSFVYFCTGLMSDLLNHFLKSAQKTRSNMRYLLNQRPVRMDAVALDKASTRAAENYLALWMLRNHYVEHLGPRSARHLNQFAQMVDPRFSLDPKPDRTADGSLRRVSVAVFTDPLNFQAVQRLTDHDANVVDWVNSQEMSSQWRDGPWIKINKLKLTPKNPTYHYILYRLDLEFAKPDHANQNANFPIFLLPEPSGRNIWTPEIWETEDRTAFSQAMREGLTSSAEANPMELQEYPLRLRQETQGLARTFSNPIIPANCLYFKDLSAIPDLAWKWRDKGADHRRCFGQFPIRFVDSAFELERADPQNEYFRRVVLLYASFPLMTPVPSDEFIDGAYPLIDYELSSIGVKPKAGQRHTNEIATSKRPINWIDEGASILASVIQRESLGSSAPLANLSRAQHQRFSRSALAATALRLGQRDVDTSYTEGVGASGQATTSDLEKKDRRTRYDSARNDENKPIVLDARYLADDIMGVAPRYTRLLNDVRRANHALRIYQKELNDYAYMHASALTSVERDKETSSESGAYPLRPFQHSRNDRYRLFDLGALRAALGLAEIVPAHNGAAPEPTFSRRVRYVSAFRYGALGAERGADRDDPFWDELISETHDETTIRLKFSTGLTSVATIPTEGPFCIRLGNAGAQTQQSEAAEKPDPFISIALGALFDENGARRDELTTFLPSADDNESSVFEWLLDTSKIDHSARSRAMRAWLLFLWGVGPCLSSLMHLDVMGEIYRVMSPSLAGVHAEWRKLTPGALLAHDRLNEHSAAFKTAQASARQSLRLWRRTLRTAEALAYLFARALEVNLAKDLNHIAQEPTEPGPGVQKPTFRPLPDMSIATLGLRLYAPEQKPAQTSAEPGAAAKDGEGWFGGVIQDILLRLQLAQIYCGMLEERIVGADIVAPEDLKVISDKEIMTDQDQDQDQDE